MKLATKLLALAAVALLAACSSETGKIESKIEGTWAFQETVPGLNETNKATYVFENGGKGKFIYSSHTPKDSVWAEKEFEVSVPYTWAVESVKGENAVIKFNYGIGTIVKTLLGIDKESADIYLNGYNNQIVSEEIFFRGDSLVLGKHTFSHKK